MLIIHNGVGYKSAKLLGEKLGCEVLDEAAASIADLTEQEVFRWGTSMNLRFKPAKVLNSKDAIRQATNKCLSRSILSENGISVPYTCYDKYEAIENLTFPFIARYKNHRHGNGFIIVNDRQTLDMINDWNTYFMEKINKMSEYRVWIFNGVPFLAHRRTNRLGELAWNGEGEVLERAYIDDVPFDVMHESIRAVEVLGLDFGAVDVGVDDNNRAYVFEVNTAPQLNDFRANKLARLVEHYFEGD
jgi:glutathione synthase/RimK-type ligase-like ATP-grasp enzyme